MTRLIVGVAAMLALLASIGTARADYHIFSPYEIDYGELEIEHNGDAVFDRRPEQRGATSSTLELGTGVTRWWHSEVELSWDRDPGFGEPTRLTGIVTENMFQLTEPGEYFADAGFYVEYAQSLTRGEAASFNTITFGPVFGKDIGRTTHIVNLFFTRQLGPDQTSQGLDFSYAWQSRWNIWDKLSPAIEVYGDVGTLGRSPGLSQQQLLVGPVGLGLIRLNELRLARGGQLKYELGWLFGATQASARGTLRWRLELEVPF